MNLLPQNQIDCTVGESLSRLQESILREYKRLSFGEQTQHYELDSISYSQIPKQIPLSFRQNYQRCLVLQNCSFYEMFTFAIFEYLFTNPNDKKQKSIKKLKQLICSEQFLQSSSYIKGLLIKGLRLVNEQITAGNKEAPVGNCLLTNECMPAYIQCWKEIVSKQIQSHLNMSDIQTDICISLSQFFQVNISIFWWRNNRYEQQNIGEQSMDDEGINIIVTATSIADSIIKTPTHKLQMNSFDDLSSIYGNSSYMILLNERKARHSSPIKKDRLSSIIQTPRTSKSQRKSSLPSAQPKKTDFKAANPQIIQTLERIKHTISQGNSLLDQCKQFLRQIDENNRENYLNK